MYTFFTASDFLPTKWSTADEKAQFGNTLLYFMLTGFLAGRFTEKLYTRLSMCYGHIAHYVEWVIMRSTRLNTAQIQRSNTRSLCIITPFSLSESTESDFLGPITNPAFRPKSTRLRPQFNLTALFSSPFARLQMRYLGRLRRRHCRRRLLNASQAPKSKR